MKIRKNALMFLAILFTMTLMLISSDDVSAKTVKFNKTSKTITKGKSYTIKISGLKLKRIKKVTLKYNKKVIKVKRIKKNTYRVVGKKKGKTTLKARVKYRTLDDSTRSKNLKCRITVKNEKKKTVSRKDEKGQTSDSSDTKKDDTSSALTDDKFLSNNKGKDIYRLNDYTIYDGERYDGAGYYGIVINYLYNDIDWYSKKEYDEIIGEAKRIVEEAGVSDDMTDQEKAWRIGRTVIYNIDYVVGCNIYKIHDAMFKKETVCAGYSTTYAFLCRYVGIDCDYVRSETHAWNLVKLGDYYYVTDLTGAYFEKNILTSDGVGEFFKERNYSNSMNEIWPCYKTEQYTKTHPVSEIDYFTRCKNEGTSYLSEKELYNLFH